MTVSSGSSIQRGSSSYGSDATTTEPSRSTRNSGSPTQVAAIAEPSVASRVRRPPPTVCTARTASRSPVDSGEPDSHRAAASPKTNAESTGADASAMSYVRSARAFRAAVQSARRPLWLNSQRCAVNGVAHDSSGPHPGDAERTAAMMHPLVIVGARDPKEASLQIDCARR